MSLVEAIKHDVPRADEDSDEVWHACAGDWLVEIELWFSHRLGLSHLTVKHHLENARSKVGATTAQFVWILAPRLPEPEDRAQTGE